MTMRDVLLLQMNRHVGAVNVVRFTADGSYCLTGADDRTVKLWNPHKLDPSQQAQGGTGSVGTSTAGAGMGMGGAGSSAGWGAGVGGALMIKSYEGAHGYRVLDVAPTKDKSRFASCGDDRTVFVWDVASGATIRRIQAHGDKTNAVRFNDDGTVLVTASYDRSVKCWDMRQGCRDPIQSMQDFKDSVTCLALTDGAILAGSVDGTVRTYDLRKGVTHTDNLRHPVTSIRSSPDSQTYLSACLDSTLRLMDVGDGKELRTYTGHTHSGYKAEADFQSDLSHVLMGSEDGTVRHWDFVTAKSVCVTRAHGKALSSVACHPSKPLFLTASYDGTVGVWENQTK